VAEDLSPVLTARLGYQLKALHGRLTAAVDRAIGSLGIEARDLAVLAVLAAEPPMSQADAGRRLGQDRTTMVATVDRLETLGLVERRADPADRRRNLLQISAAGRRLHDRGERARAAAETSVLAALSTAEAATLRRLLGRLLAP
jgi:DNA-binding MarR family transcriptional regulator